MPVTRDSALRLLGGESPDVVAWNRFRLQETESESLAGLDLSGSLIHGANLSDLDLRSANFCGTRLNNANLRRSRLQTANLGMAGAFQGADFSGADLRDASFAESELGGALMIDARVDGASFREAFLQRTSFIRCTLKGAGFSEAVFGDTLFDCDLRGVFGLADARHRGPSQLTLATLRDSIGELPPAFLQGCGVAEADIGHFRQVRSLSSCFISYSSSDEEFATELYGRLQANGIRCWKWNEDARGGKELRGQIDRAIRRHEKLVLIASRASLCSAPVLREIERALQIEDKTKTDKLLPIQIDDYLFSEWDHPLKADVVAKFVRDARNWKADATVITRLVAKLTRDLVNEVAP